MVGTLLYAPPERRGKGRMDNAPIYIPADLVLLVNSAAESIYAKKMIDMLSEAAPGRPKPLVISGHFRGCCAANVGFDVCPWRKCYVEPASDMFAYA
jgi:hypothetical protein